MQDNVLDLTKKLISIPSVSDDGNETISDFIENWLKNHGFDEVERLEYTEADGTKKVNLLACKGEGTGGLAFLAHSDTVPGQEDEWPAFDPQITDERLHGRGSCDMKGPLAAAMLAAGAVDADDLKQPLSVVVTADEELGLLGAEYVVEHSQLLPKYRPEYGVVIEPTSMIPVYAHKGYLRFIVTAHGRAAHTSSGQGDSSLFKLAPFLADMAALNERFKSEPRFMNDEFDPPTNGFNMVIVDNGRGNVTASKTECWLSIRAMPDAGIDEITEIVTAKTREYDLDLEILNGEPVYTDKNSALVKAACAATENPNPETVPYGTDGFHFQKMMDIVILGPGDIAVAHTTQEFVPVDELESAVNVYSRMIEMLCM